jgi:hypothetical protein
MDVSVVASSDVHRQYYLQAAADYSYILKVGVLLLLLLLLQRPAVASSCLPV